MSYSRSLLEAARALKELTLETRDPERLAHIRKVLGEFEWLLNEAGLSLSLGRDLVGLAELQQPSEGFQAPVHQR